MSKDNKPEKSFPERLKRWFKIERGNFPGCRYIRLTEELKTELGNESPVAVRLKAIRELNEVLISRKLEEYGIEKLWFLIQDLLSLTCPAEHRHTTLQMLTTLTAGHDRLGPMRHVFFNYISDNYQREDTKPIFDFFREVIAEGKQLEYIDEYVGPFLLEWLPGLLASPQAADALNLVITLVKFNSAYLDEPVVTGYVTQVVLQLHKAGSESEAFLCLRVLDAVLAYSYLPSSALPTFITALTRAVSMPELTLESWKIMRNLLGTHLGNSGLCVLCHLIRNNSDALMVRGAIFFLTTALWGANKVSSLDYKPAAVLPTFREAANNGHVLVVYEVALSIQKLVSKMYMELHLSSWEIVLDTLSKLFEHTVAMEEGHEKQIILTLLKDIMDMIEQLIDLQQFGGSSDKFFSLINLYSYLRPESSVLRLLDHLAQGVDPLRPHWLANLSTLLNQFFCRDHRPNVRTKALAILADIYNNNRHMHGAEMIRNVICIQMEGIEAERDVGVRTAAVNLLVHIALTQRSYVVPDILNLLEKIVFAPYLNKGDCVKVVKESEAADIIAAVAGLIRIFKKKLWQLPSSYAIQTYGILLACLEQHYRYQSVLQGVSRVRLKIFEMIFEMRANARYQLGFPRISGKGAEEEDRDSIASLIPPYSPYIVVDHKHGQRLDEAQREREYKGGQNDATKEHGDVFGKNSSALPTVLPLDSEAEVTHLSLTQAAMTVIVAMKKEKDWEVLRMILERVPQVLLNKALILSRDGNDIDYFAAALCSLVTDKTLGLPETLHNTPTKFTRSDFQSYVFPVLATLASYHMHLDSVIQQKVIKCLELGVLSRCAGPLCVSALTLCVLEMRDSMIKLLREVMLNLSKITATVQNAQPILEFLSTLLHLPKVYASFVSDQYMSIFAIAIPYTNPFKFNHYIVSLAYHVISMWFLKCRLPFRQAFVPFIAKNLNMVVTTEEAAARRRSASASDQGRGGKGDVDMMMFHNDLRETCLDLMSRYTYSDFAPPTKRSAVSKMFVEEGQDQTWVLGSKIVTITTSGCSKRPLRNGLCAKCIEICNIEKGVTVPEAVIPGGLSVHRRRHRSELHRTISHEIFIYKFSTQGRGGKGDVDMMMFHNDLRETCLDLMSRYTYSDFAPPTKRSAVSKMFVEEGQDQTWVLGSKIVTITTSGCSKRPLRNGLCAKCIEICNIEKGVTVPEAVIPGGLSVHRRRHRSELHRTISHEAKYMPQSKDDLHMRSAMRDSGDGLTPLIDQDDVGWSGDGLGESTNGYSSIDRLGFGLNVGPASAPNSEDEKKVPHLCACWCFGWAEIFVRQPTGNMSWMIRLQNPQVLTPGLRHHLQDISDLFTPTTSKESSELSSLPMEDEQNEELLNQHFEDPRPRAFSGASDKTHDSDLGSRRDSSGCSSGAPSHASSDLLINATDTGDDTRGSSPLTNTSTSGENPDDPRVPVQRCHSSPEMSEGVVAGGGETSQQPLNESEGKVPTSPSTSPGPTETTPVAAVTRQVKPKPRLESMTGGGSVGSISPPPVASTRVRHTSAFQTKNSGSNSSISSSSGLIGTSNTEEVDDSSPRPMRRDRGHTISDMNPASRKLHGRATGAAKKKNSNKDIKGGISPGFVFLQLYYEGTPEYGKELPHLLPTHQPEIQRAMRVLDLMRHQETHKIGVLYVAQNQTSEQEILRNSCGSLRYMHFLQGLGTVLELNSVSQDEVFLGGLDTKGNDGKLVCIWHDEVMQVVFHVATMMPTKESDPNCNGKKRHIGNNYVTIVYNESGKPYNINTIKGQFNHTVVEIVPADYATNSVGVLGRPELMEFVGGSSDSRLVSDTNLPILVRQLALHADLASTIWESLNRPPFNPYASNWVERMRKIRKIRQMVVAENEAAANPAFHGFH
ncbi:tuberin [Procambarus clarkii]|uniref:tuberin n=1 Tax=Procambarus clarkii TaxID=6728 RepID=UPI003743ACB1